MSFESTYNKVFGNLGNKKQQALQHGWRVAKDEIDGAESTFRKQANKAGWRVFDQGYNLYLTWKGLQK